MIRRGDIRWFRFQVPDKRRPVLILGRDDLRQTLSQIPVIPLSTQTRGLGWEVRLTSADGLLTECVLKPEWIRSVERAHIGPYIASLPRSTLARDPCSLLAVLGFES
jgi:mRNA-degrading endonuclease toxin of MazEF toxin-antitoxin module